MKYLLIILLVGLLVIKLYKKIMIQIGRNSLLSEQKILEIAADYIAHQKQERAEIQNKADDPKSILHLQNLKEEISKNKIFTIRQLEAFLSQKMEKEFKDDLTKS